MLGQVSPQRIVRFLTAEKPHLMVSSIRCGFSAFRYDRPDGLFLIANQAVLNCYSF